MLARFAVTVMFFLFVLNCLTIAPASAQDNSPAAVVDSGHENRPWFIMAARPVIAGGAGSIQFNWEAFGGLADYDEEADFSAGYMTIIPEAFFMPTQARQFIISASLPLAFGSGTFEETDDKKVIDGESFRFFSWHIAVGLGYQWFFGTEERTNLFLMSHLGGGRYRISIEYNDEEYTSDPLRSWYVDLSIGSTHRFENNFVLGGSLDLGVTGFAGEAGGDDFMDVDVNGGFNAIRFNPLTGYAVY